MLSRETLASYPELKSRPAEDEAKWAVRSFSIASWIEELPSSRRDPALPSWEERVGLDVTMEVKSDRTREEVARLR